MTDPVPPSDAGPRAGGAAYRVEFDPRPRPAHYPLPWLVWRGGSLVASCGEAIDARRISHAMNGAPPAPPWVYVAGPAGRLPATGRPCLASYVLPSDPARPPLVAVASYESAAGWIDSRGRYLPGVYAWQPWPEPAPLPQPEETK